jgi:hypothetical protein
VKHGRVSSSRSILPAQHSERELGLVDHGGDDELGLAQVPPVLPSLGDSVGVGLQLLAGGFCGGESKGSMAAAVCEASASERKSDAGRERVLTVGGAERANGGRGRGGRES